MPQEAIRSAVLMLTRLLSLIEAAELHHVVATRTITFSRGRVSAGTRDVCSYAKVSISTEGNSSLTASAMALMTRSWGPARWPPSSLRMASSAGSMQSFMLSFCVTESQGTPGCAASIERTCSIRNAVRLALW